MNGQADDELLKIAGVYFARRSMSCTLLGLLWCVYSGGGRPPLKSATLHQDWIEEYAAEMAGDAKFPPVVVFFDGDRHWLGDGFHRTHAAVAVA